MVCHVVLHCKHCPAYLAIKIDIFLGYPPLDSYGEYWQVWEQTPGVYVPQVGDQVVYLQQGHKLYYERLREKRRGPWDTIVSTAVGSATCQVCPALASTHYTSL